MGLEYGVGVFYDDIFNKLSEKMKDGIIVDSMLARAEMLRTPVITVSGRYGDKSDAKIIVTCK